LRHRLETTFGNRTRAIGKTLATLEDILDGRMRLETLELFKGRQIRVLVVEVEHETDRNHIVLEMIEERAAAGLHVERPAEGVLNQARLVPGRIDLPQLLEPDTVFRRFAALIKLELRDQLLGKRTPRA